MPIIQDLSTTLLDVLRNFGEDKLHAALQPCGEDNIPSPEQKELLEILDNQIYSYRPQFEITEKRPVTLECDVVKFQNKKEKWVAFVGLLDGYPYEIFTGVLDDEDGIALPKTVTKGYIVKNYEPDGSKRYDFTFVNRRGYKITVEGLSEKFNKEYWNYAKLISGVLRYRMPLSHVIKLVSQLQVEDENISTWAVGVARALKRYTSSSDDISSDTSVDEELLN